LKRCLFLVFPLREATTNRSSLRSIVALIMISLMMGACGGGTEPAPDGALSGPVSAVDVKGRAILEWDAVADPRLSGYRIYYGLSSGKYIQPFGQGITIGNSSSFTLSGLTSGTRYYFAVTAIDDAGSESGYSNEVFKDIL